MKIFLFFLVLLTVISFNINLKAQEITVEKFSKIPKYIDGCGCFFYLKKSDDNTNYIFVSMYGGDGAMKIDGSMQRLKLITESYSKGYYAKYSNKSYEVEIKGKETGSGEESTDYKGKITVRNKNTDAEITIKFVGSCGC